MKEFLLLDTNVVVWLTLEQEKLPSHIKQKIDLELQNGTVMISSITLWEIAMLAEKKRINIFEPLASFLQSIAEIKGLTVLEISPMIAAESVRLPDNFHGDPSDRIIVASALCNGGTLLTKDRKILDWAQMGHIKALEA